MPEIEAPISRPTTPPAEEAVSVQKSGAHERKKSKIFVLFNQLLHSEDQQHQERIEPSKFKHSVSKSLSSVPKGLNSPNDADRIPKQSIAVTKTNPNTPKGQVKMTQKILEFLHIKEREGAELDVEISDEELEMLKETVPLIHDRNDLSFKLKYHFVGSKIIGRGASGIVRLAAGNMDEDSKQRFAVKELRRRKRQEGGEDYLKKLMREFRIAMLMHHKNVVNTIDFVMIGDKWYEVMEYCSGGDLFAAIQRGKMGQAAIDCCFKQLVAGVRYLHEMGVSHRDLKPENLLIDDKGHLKITDFGVSEVFCDLEWYLGDIPSLKEKQTTTETNLNENTDSAGSASSDNNEVAKPIHKLKGLCGSCPYIAPEEFTGQEYDGRLVDVWSIGIIYYAMIFHCVPWEMAHPKNPNYKQFLEEGFDAFEPFRRLPAKPRALLKRILEPDPMKRATIEEICADEWFKEIKNCTEIREDSPTMVYKNSLSYNCDFDQDDDHLCHIH